MGVLIGLLFYSCTTTVPYHNIHEINVYNHLIYTFNNNKYKALIYIDGSGLNSVLGVKNTDKWTSVNFSYFIANNLNSDFTLVIPEKLNFKKGIDYTNNSEVLLKYTVENLVESYSSKIDYYIENNKNVNEIYLLGISEGGLLVPKILNTIKNKSKIKKMVIWGAGGYSQKECFKILAKSAIQMPETYRNECKKISEVEKDIEQNPKAIDKYYLGWPYSRWSSFFKYQPIDEYVGIDIPVLFIQGLKDYNSPFESVKYIEEEYRNKNYEYAYYRDMGHIPEKKEDIARIIQSIYSWIKK
jgi:esterase/lipase